jgi:nucleoside-diphosphate-sugar epimerase
MSHVVVTGSEGFVGQALVQRLLAEGLGGRPVTRLSLLDIRFAAPHADARVVQLPGSIADPDLRERAYASHPVDAVFHLASIPGGAAEKNYELGRSINLEATLGCWKTCARRRPAAGVRRASSSPAPSPSTASTCRRWSTKPRCPTPASPTAPTSWPASTWWPTPPARAGCTGCSLRLPGVVARP